MSQCRHCGQSGQIFSPRLGYCAACIRSHFNEIWPEIEAYHHESRKAFRLPIKPPRDPEGKACTLCFHACRIPEGGYGFCGARRVSGGRLKGGNPAGAGVSFYYDPLPTNCVADWFCPGGTGRGYPKYACADGPERGYVNLAVFYQACNFNCLFCQNWTFKRQTFGGDKMTAAELAKAAHARTACICYFGATPRLSSSCPGGLPFGSGPGREGRAQAPDLLGDQRRHAGTWLKPLLDTSLPMAALSSST